jgi:hypothetical protein
MSDHGGAEGVGSGLSYSVMSVNGRVPGSLDDFGTDIVEVTLSRGEQFLRILGTWQRVDDRSVVMFEKTHDGTGKDLRTWAIIVDANGLEAIERSMF